MLLLLKLDPYRRDTFAFDLVLLLYTTVVWSKLSRLCSMFCLSPIFSLWFNHAKGKMNGSQLTNYLRRVWYTDSTCSKCIVLFNRCLPCRSSELVGLFVVFRGSLFFRVTLAQNCELCQQFIPIFRDQQHFFSPIKSLFVFVENACVCLLIVLLELYRYATRTERSGRLTFCAQDPKIAVAVCLMMRVFLSTSVCFQLLI